MIPFALQLRKIFTELWFNKTRTILVVLTLAIGVLVVGTISRSWAILSRNLIEGYQAVNPANGIVFASQFDDDLVEAIRKMPEVQDAEGRRLVDARIRGVDGEWYSLELIVLADDNDLRINKIGLQDGQWPPPTGTMLLERSSLELFKGQTSIKTTSILDNKFWGTENSSELIGQRILIEMQNGKQREIGLVGIVHDLTQYPSVFSKNVYGYISPKTLKQLTGSTGYDRLLFVVGENADDETHVQSVTRQIIDKVRASGVIVRGQRILDSDKHPLESILQTVLFILAALGTLAFFLSIFQIFNTISTLLARQVKQIGIMKAIGASQIRIVIIYLGLVFSFALLAMTIAIPGASFAARLLSLFLATLLNLNITNFEVPFQVVALEWGAGLMMPLVTALIPIINGTRITVREAISSQAISVNFGSSFFDQFLNQIRVLPISLRYALRNTFRHKTRLAFTLMTLTVASTIFITLVSIRASLLLTIDDVAKYWLQDIEIDLQKSYRIEKIEHAGLSFPAVKRVESWRTENAFRLRPDGTQSQQRITIYGVAAPTHFIEPTILEGRWLLPEDNNAIVININLLAEEQDISIGDEIVIQIEKRETEWQVVGLVTGQIVGGGGLMVPLAYVNYPYLTQVVGGGKYSDRVLIDLHTNENIGDTAKRLQEHFHSLGVRVEDTELHTELRETLEYPFQVLLVLIFLMVILFAVAGGLGLMSMMSLSMLERIKEIGMIRAIGATNGMVAQLVMIEGIFIGLLSWGLGSVLALPLSKFLSETIGILFLKVPLNVAFPINGVLLWLVIVILLSALASFLPARNASQVSVQEALAYQ